MSELAERLAAAATQAYSEGDSDTYDLLTEAARAIREAGDFGDRTVMHGRIVAANFPDDTLTLRMEPGYYAAAGRYRIAPTPDQERTP